MSYRFENLLLDAERRELRAGEKLLKLQPRVFDLILYLVRNRDRVIGKEELLDRLWPDVIVVEGALQRAVSLARSCMREACGKDCIRTHARKGYRFVAAVAELDEPAAHEAAPTDGKRVPSKPVIVVLPFANPGDDAEQALIAEGLAEDISAGLSRLRCLFVISRASSLLYRGSPHDLETAAGELGARYALLGSVHRAADRLRVHVELIDCPSRAQIWAQRFDRKIDNLFQIQDEITAAVVAEIEPEFNQFERERARVRPPDNLDAWGAYQRGLWHLYQFTRADVVAALPLFELAISLDDQFASAHAGASFCHFSNAYLEYADNWQHAVEQARVTAEHGVAADNRCPAAHWALGRALLLQGELDAAIDEIEISIELNPSFAQAFYMLGWINVLAGKPEKGLDYIDSAERLSPRDPLLFAFRMVRAMAYLLLREYPQALKYSSLAVRQPNSHQHTLAVHVAALVGCEQLDKARGAVARIFDIDPHYSCADYARGMPYRSREDLASVTAPLQQAGVPPDSKLA